MKILLLENNHIIYMGNNKDIALQVYEKIIKTDPSRAKHNFKIKVKKWYKKTSDEYTI